jgi:ABC-type glycerol-3-phosphate transport system permease component
MAIKVKKIVLSILGSILLLSFIIVGIYCAISIVDMNLTDSYTEFILVLIALGIPITVGLMCLIKLYEYIWEKDG